MPRPGSRFLSCLLTLLAASAGYAGPLQQATVSRIVNEVRLVDPKAGSRPAALQDVVRDDLGVRTGQSSRAELLFQDKTLTRLGAETFFSFQPGTRDMTLREGTMLLQVPKGQGGARIKTAAVTAAITGTTILLEHWPGKNVKVLVLEGSLRLSVNGRPGEAVTLTPGRMIMMKPDARSLPRPVDVDLRKVVKTSALVNPDAFKGNGKGKVAPLPSLALIETAIAEQQQLKAKGALVETNIVLPGKGSGAVLADTQSLKALEAVVEGTATKTVEAASSTPAQEKRTQVVANIQVRESAEAGGGPANGLALGQLPRAERENEAGRPGRGSNNGRGPKGEKPEKPTPGVPSGPPGRTPPVVISPRPASDFTLPILIDPPLLTLFGDYKYEGDRTGLQVLLPIVAHKLELKSEAGIDVLGAILANELKVDADGSTTFASLVQANKIDAKAKGTFTLLGAVGAEELKIEAPLIVANSLQATTNMELKGTFVGGGAANLLAGPKIEITNGVSLNGAAAIGGASPVAPEAGRGLTIFSNELKLSAVSANGGDAAIDGTEGGNGGRLFLGTTLNPIGDKLELNRPIVATTGKNATGTSYGGAGGEVSAIGAGELKVNTTIKVSESASGRASKAGGTIRLETLKMSGTAINLENSAQLLALLDGAAPGPGGRIEVTSAGGDILINGSKLQADRGAIELRNAGAGNITLRNATLSADVIKAGVFGPNGQLVIGGGSLSADSAIKLYAHGANGAVVFNDNVALNGNSVKTIAGQTVSIAGGKTVTVNGPNPAQVFTDRPNYSGSGGNGSTSGKFGGKGASTAPFGSRPNY